MTYRQWSLIAAVVAASVGVAGCGGDDATPSESATTTTTVTGSGGTGAPIVGGTPSLLCAGGITTTGTVLTDATGTFTITSTTGAAPCLVTITGGTGNVGRSLHSIHLTGQARANVNHLTHLMAIGLAKGDPATLLTSTSLGTLVTSALVTVQKAIAQQVITALAAQMGIAADFDFLTANYMTSSSVIGTLFDKLLDNITVPTATSPTIVFKVGSITIVTLSFTSTTGLTGTTSGTISTGALDLGGLQAFVTSLQTNVFATTATFANPSDGQNKLSGVLGSGFGLAPTTNALFTLVSTGNVGLGVKINPTFAALAGLTARVPTIGTVISNVGGLLNAIMTLNFTKSATDLTVTQQAARVARDTTAATAGAWKLQQITP